MSLPARVCGWIAVLATAVPLAVLSQTPPPLPTPSAPPAFRPRVIPAGQAATSNAVRATGSLFAQPPGVPTAPLAIKNNPNALKFDAVSKSVDLKAGEHKAPFVFALTNNSTEPVTITGIQTSCGCTAGKLPRQPWILQPGESGTVDVTMDLTGKFGTITKTATISSSAGPFILTVRATAPQPDPTAMRAGDRTKNLQVAAADRQAVFRNDCATCHVHPVTGKVGKALYDSACGICHDAEHRASMVPILRDPKRATDKNYWTKWISEGREGSLMPAFALNRGGILTEQQITSLVDYLESDFKQEIKLAKPTAAVAPTGAPSAPVTK
jgi:cytochrome c5